MYAVYKWAQTGVCERIHGVDLSIALFCSAWRTSDGECHNFLCGKEAFRLDATIFSFEEHRFRDLGIDFLWIGSLGTSTISSAQLSSREAAQATAKYKEKRSGHAFLSSRAILVCNTFF